MGRTVVVQARVSQAEAESAQQDAAALGLDGTSQAVREGLALLHRKARLAGLAQSYDDFYGGQPAPLSEVTPEPPPFRGDVWDVAFPGIGAHPAVALTTNALRGRLSTVTVVLVTGTPGPALTHVSLGPAAGLTKYDISYANVTDLHTVPVQRCRQLRGRLSADQMGSLESALALVLGLPGGG